MEWMKKKTFNVPLVQPTQCKNSLQRPLLTTMPFTIKTEKIAFLTFLVVSFILLWIYLNENLLRVPPSSHGEAWREGSFLIFLHCELGSEKLFLSFFIAKAFGISWFDIDGYTHLMGTLNGYKESFRYYIIDDDFHSLSHQCRLSHFSHWVSVTLETSETSIFMKTYVNIYSSVHRLWSGFTRQLAQRMNQCLHILWIEKH